MKFLLSIVVSLFFVASAVAGDVIIKEADGQWVPAPDGYKAVFVPIETGDVLVEVKGVEVVEPGNGWTPGEPLPADEPAEEECVPEGGLVLGSSTPCND